MTQCLFYHVTIVRDANTKIPRVVAAWELPILQEAHGASGVIIGDEWPREFSVPDIEPEFARLQRVYGDEPDSKISYAEVTYGRSTIGMRALAKAITQSVVQEKPRLGRPPKATESEAQAG